MDIMVDGIVTDLRRLGIAANVFTSSIKNILEPIIVNPLTK